MCIGDQPWFDTELDANGDVIGTDRRKWVPVPPVERRCEKRCCHRAGVPLVTAKADSCHCCQGMSCGEGKAIERVVGFWSADAEKRWPGILYVLASRCGREDDLRLAGAQGEGTLPTAAFDVVGTGDVWKKTDKEVRSLREMHSRTLRNAKAQHTRNYGNPRAHGGFGSVEHWAYLCKQVVARGREHLEAEPARMTERDRSAVQAVVNVWSV